MSLCAWLEFSNSIAPEKTIESTNMRRLDQLGGELELLRFIEDARSAEVACWRRTAASEFRFGV
jgi:hypothetical protein